LQKLEMSYSGIRHKRKKKIYVYRKKLLLKVGKWNSGRKKKVRTSQRALFRSKLRSLTYINARVSLRKNGCNGPLNFKNCFSEISGVM